MSEEFIQSRQNPRIKILSKLHDRKLRDKMGIFSVEGLRELSRAMQMNVEFQDVYFCPEFFKTQEHSKFLEQLRENKIPLCRLSESAFEKISNREGCDGLLGIAKQYQTDIDNLKIKANKLLKILIVDGIEKPGNMGALMRSGDSAGIDAFIITNRVVDIFNPAVIRASQGACFSLNVAVCEIDECVKFLRANNVKLYATMLSAKEKIWDIDFTKSSSAILMGSEKEGISPLWNEHIDTSMIIPMNGLSDSMNVNVAAALCLYELNRQFFWRL